MDSVEDELRSMSCFCQGMCPYGMEYGTCQTKPGGKCFTSVELDLGDDGNQHPILSYGCLPPNEMALFQCRSTLIATKDGKNIKCCDEYDFCNKHLLPIVEKADNPEVDYFHSMTVKVLLLSISICLAVFLAGLMLTYFKIKREIKQKKKTEQDAELPSIHILSAPNRDPNIFNLSTEEDSGIRVGADLCDSSHESSGIRSELVQRTISKQITFELMIASGKYTEVWRAKWRGEKVAVKIYDQRQEESWMREIKIFQTPLLRHEHILGYIAADVKENGPITQMYLITEYHSYGSLRDYLRSHTVTLVDLLEMIKGLAGALNHLHTEIIGSSRKPCITHNNINSKNVLVKKDKQCCLGDFSKAIQFFSSEDNIETSHNTENTDIRYLAPEFLEQNHSNTIEAFKMGDVYSFSLVLWEIISRCDIGALTDDAEYQIPYEEELTAENLDFVLKNVTELVSNKKIRPKLKKEWEEDPVLKMVTKVMVECWSATPSVRLTSLRVKKTLFKIQINVSDERQQQQN